MARFIQVWQFLTDSGQELNGRQATGTEYLFSSWRLKIEPFTIRVLKIFKNKITSPVVDTVVETVAAVASASA